MRTINAQIRDVAIGQLTVEQVLDEGVGSYAVDYFSFGAAGWEPTAAEYKAYQDIVAGYKARQVPRERTVAPTKQGASVGRTQLWEPCERCGREPSYVTSRGHLCGNCAPEAQ
jgi:hypothetical protein